ncbi:MAG TPA: hypothetical protein VF768_07090 [Holophagaceae bacterium]
MKDLYREIGLPGRVEDPKAIERALQHRNPSPELARRVRFVLLHPARKARYDEILAHATALAEVRRRLRLPADPWLPVEAKPEPFPAGPGGGIGPAWSSGLWIGGSIAVLLVVLAWFALRGERSVLGPRPAPSEPMRSTSAGPPQGAPPGQGGSAKDLQPVSPPDHGWCQFTLPTAPSVPWRIDTEAGQDYLVTLLDARTHATVLTLFLKGGQPYEGLAPEGTFELLLASGAQWFGLRRGFGPEGRVVQSPQVYRIRAGSDRGATWNLVLHPSGCETAPVTPVDPKGSFPSVSVGEDRPLP